MVKFVSNMSKETKPRQSLREERLIQQYIDKVEQGDETIIRRICETLAIDSETKPTVEQVREFVKIQKDKPRHARRRS